MKKFTAISLFSGAGGLDMGFERAGFKIIWANASNADACKTHEKWSGAKVICGDIAKIEASDIPDANIILGGFPCQGFSLSGSRKIDDVRNKLYRQYVRVLKAKKPAMFAAENVKGILTMGEGRVINAILREFSDCGYEVFYKLLNAKDYEVPQDRERVIIVGFRRDLKVQKLQFPPPRDYVVTLREALKNMPEPAPDDVCQAPYSSRYMSRNRKRGWDEVSYTIPAKVVCKECGKEFLTIYGKLYCSSLCWHSSRVKKTRCPVCGQNLFSAGIESIRDTPCSPECRAVHDNRKAKKNGRYKTCLQCGKEFIASEKGNFCCQDCRRTYIKTHKKSSPRSDAPSRKKKLDAYGKKTCQYCGRSYVLSDFWKSEVFCSSMCRDKATPKAVRHIPPCRALEKNRPKPKVPQPIHLCTACRTKQSQCERFISQFMSFPKGTVTKQMEGKQIVVSCPKFSATAAKKNK